MTPRFMTPFRWGVLAGVALAVAVFLVGVMVVDAAAGVLDNPVPSAAAGTVNHVRSTSEPVPTTSTTSTMVASARTAPTPPASASDRGETTPAGADATVVELRTTSYCLTGEMASGRPTYVGAVAANRFALGTRMTAWPNPWGDPAMVFTVEDRHAPGATELDFAMPGECDRALAWGNRQHARVQVVG